jgi:hypothetical protein
MGMVTTLLSMLLPGYVPFRCVSIRRTSLQLVSIGRNRPCLWCVVSISACCCVASVRVLYLPRPARAAVCLLLAVPATAMFGFRFQQLCVRTSFAVSCVRASAVLWCVGAASLCCVASVHVPAPSGACAVGASISIALAMLFLFSCCSRPLASFAGWISVGPYGCSYDCVVASL